MVWYVSPHFHVIGCGYLKKADLFYKESGWVYKNHKRRETIAGTVIYTLTHCGVHPDLHAVTYFGFLFYNKIVIESKMTWDDPVECQSCGEYLREYALVEVDGRLEPDWREDLGEYHRKVVKRTYGLRGVVEKYRDLNLLQQRLSKNF